MNNKITTYAIIFDSKLLLFNLNFGTNKNNTISKIITVTSNVNNIGPQVNEIRSGLLNANTDKSKTRAKVVTIGDEILIGQIIDTNSVFITNQQTPKKFG